MAAIPPALLLVAWPSRGAPDAGLSTLHRDGSVDGAHAERGAFDAAFLDAGMILDARAGDAGARRDSGPISKIPPDPVPLEEQRQWVVDLRWERGDVFLTAVRPLDLEAPRTTPRVMGRFALELFDGKTLIERVRFDFPGLLDGDFVDAGHADPPRMDRKLTTRIGVLFPRTNRGTRLELWDRATDRRWPLGWPPKPPTSATE